MAVSRCIACLKKTMRTICGVFTCDITSSSTMPRAILSLSFKRHTFFLSIIKIDTKYLILVSLLSIFVATSKPSFRSCVLIYILSTNFVFKDYVKNFFDPIKYPPIQLKNLTYIWFFYIYIYRVSWVNLYALN